MLANCCGIREIKYSRICCWRKMNRRWLLACKICPVVIYSSLAFLLLQIVKEFAIHSLSLNSHQSRCRFLCFWMNSDNWATTKWNEPFSSLSSFTKWHCIQLPVLFFGGFFLCWTIKYSTLPLLPDSNLSLGGWSLQIGLLKGVNRSNCLSETSAFLCCLPLYSCPQHCTNGGKASFMSLLMHLVGVGLTS